MSIAIGVTVIIACSAVVIAMVAALIVVMGREYDRHPWFRKWMDTEAAMHGAYADDPDLTDEYLAEVPGGWDKL